MTEVTKSSDEILTELFDSFKAEASVDVSDNSVTLKSPKDESSRSKKKRKKDKKHKSDEKEKHRKKKKCKRHKKKESTNQSDKSNKPKKKKKRKYSSDSYDSEVEAKQNTQTVSVESCNKENNLPEEKKTSEVAISNLSSVVNNFAVACDTSSIPLPPSVGDSILTPKVAQEVPEVKKPQVSEVFEKHAENVGKPPKKLFLQGLDKPKMSIKIGNLKNSQVLEAAEEAKIKADKYEEGEITDENSEESTKLLMKIEMETAPGNGSIDCKKQKLLSEQKKCSKRSKSPDSATLNTSTSSSDIKSDDHKTNISEGSNGVQINIETSSVSETSEKENKKSKENEPSHKNALADNKNQLKLKKLRQLRERKLDNSSSEDEYTNGSKSPSSKSSKDNSKKPVNKSKIRSNKLKSTTDSDGSSSSSESSNSSERNRSSKSKEKSTALKDVKSSSKAKINSVSRRNSSPKIKHRKSRSRDRSASTDKHSRPKGKKIRSSSRSEIRKSRSVSKSRVRNSRSQSRNYSRKSRSVSRTRRKKSLSRFRDRKSRSVSYSRSRTRRSRSRSRVRRSRTPKKHYGRISRSASKQKKSSSPSRAKTKKSRSPSRGKTRRSSSPSVSRGRRSRSIKRKSRSRGRMSSRSPSKVTSFKSTSRRSSSRHRSGSKSRHSRSENRRSRSKNERSTKRRSRSRNSHSRSKQSTAKNFKGKERSGRSSSSKHSCSKLSDSGSERSESDSKYKGSKKKKSKEKKSNSKKHKSRHKDINSRLLALSSTKVESSSEDSSSDSESGDSDIVRKKSSKLKNSSRDKTTLTSEDKKSKTTKSKKELKGKKTNDKIDLIESTNSKILKEVDPVDDSDNLKPKINLQQKIHYSLMDDDPIAMTESEMKILNAKNKILLSKTVNPISTFSTDLSTKNLTEKEVKNKDLSCFKKLKSKLEGKTSDIDILKNTIGKPKLENQLKKLKADEAIKAVTQFSPKKGKTGEITHIGKSEDSSRNAKDIDITSIRSENGNVDKFENSKKLTIEDAVKNRTDEAPAEENKSDKFNITKTKNSLKDDARDSEGEIEMAPTASSYDSDGQRSDTAMRNMFFGCKSSGSNSPDADNESSVKRGGSHSSEESESESDNEKTFFGISKDRVENNYEISSKTESLDKVSSHSSDSNGSSIDKNITDSDEDLSYVKKIIISDSPAKDFKFEKPNSPVKDHLKVENTNVQSVVEGDGNSNIGSITKDSNLSTSSDPTLPKVDKKTDISLDVSPKRTNSQDFLYDYEKSEIEDEKLDFDEDKSSGSDATSPLILKEDIKIENQKGKSDFVIKVKTEVNIEEDCKKKIVKKIQEDISSTVVVEKIPISNKTFNIKEGLSNLVSEKVVCEEKIAETVSDQISSNSCNNTIIANTLDIPVPSVDKLDDMRIPFPCDDYKKEFSVSNKSSSNLTKQNESKTLDKVDETAVNNKNVPTTNFLKDKESAVRTDDSTLCSMPVEDKKHNITAPIVKSVSRSRSRSKINKRSSKTERSKSRSRRETSSSRKSKSKERSTSRRSKSKSKEKASNRKGRSKSRDKRSRSKGRHSVSKERRRRSREKRSLSGSGRSRSKDKGSRPKDRRSRERRSRSRRRALSRSKRRSRSRVRNSKSTRRNRSRSRDKRSRSRDRRKRSRSHDKRSRSRGRRAHSHSRDRRSRSRRNRGRSQSSRDRRSRSHTRKERSRTNSKDRSVSKDKKSTKKDIEHRRSSKVKLYSRSKSSEKKSEMRSDSSDKKARSPSKRGRSKSISRSPSKEKEEKSIETNFIEKPEAIDKTILNVMSPVQSSNRVIQTDKKSLSSSDRSSSSEKEMDTKSSSSEKSPDRSSKEKSPSPPSSNKNTKKYRSKSRSRSNSVSKLNTDSNSGNKKSKSPDTKIRRSRTKSPVTKSKRSSTRSPDTKPKRLRTESPDSKTRRSRSKSRDKRKGKEKRVKSKDRSRSKETKSKSAKGRKSRSRERKSKTDEKSSKSQRKRSRTRSKSKGKNKSRDKRSRSRERRSKSRDKKSRRSRSRSRRRKSDKKDRSRRSRSRSKSRTRKRSKKSRSRSRSKDEFFIDKSKLLEIARKNALSMMKQGAVGTDLNKVTAITAGGKTVDELTDFCKLLSQKDATGQESVSSESSSENESEKPFHHPFQLKERSNNIIMNIRNCASLPVKTHLEKTTENAQQLRLQFPVSSGQLHRKSENEWIPVSPKKTDELKAIMPAPLRKQEEELAVYPGLQETAHFSTIPLPNSIPHPQPHLPTIPQIGNPWPKPHDSGLFTGTTGARFLSQAELAAGQQAWAKKVGQVK